MPSWTFTKVEFDFKMFQKRNKTKFNSQNYVSLKTMRDIDIYLILYLPYNVHVNKNLLQLYTINSRQFK